MEVMEYKNTYKGGCHCGNVQFELRSNKSESDLAPRTCQCTLCRMHGASWISDPEGKLVVQKTDDLSRYRFGTGTADFIVCPGCGVLTLAICEVEGRKRAVLNIKSMLDHEFTGTETKTNFDNENVEQRLARRGRNWTGEVIFTERLSA